VAASGLRCGPSTTLSYALHAALKPRVPVPGHRVTHALRPCSVVRRMRLTLPAFVRCHCHMPNLRQTLSSPDRKLPPRCALWFRCAIEPAYS
jgi:hypothetical protein